MNGSSVVPGERATSDVKVSIVIPAHNAGATIGKCVRACLQQRYPGCEVVVVDDGSNDATPHIVSEFPVILIQQRQRGPAAARNAGARASTGEIIAFTDSDCCPHPSWVERLVSGIQGDFAAAGGSYGISNRGEALAQIVNAEIAMRHACFAQSIDFAGSYNFAILREVFEKLNGFDELFTSASGEDNDICYRVLDMGYKIASVPNAYVDHYHPERLGRYLRTQARHGFWRMKLYRKHPRRGRGDHYAGPFDLLAPIFALMLLFLPIFVFLPHARVMQLIALIGAGVLLLFRIQSAICIRKKKKQISFFYCFWVLVLRDCARAVGMIAGVWHFLVLRRTTA